MLHQEFKNGPKDIGIIVGPKYYNFTDFIGRNYGIPLKRLIPDVPQRMITISTFEPQDKKINKKQLVEHCADLLESVATMGIDKMLVSSADYFKYLSGQKDFEGSIGLIYQCVVEGYEYITVCPCINPAVLNAQPNKKPLLDKALDVFGKLVAGTYSPPEEFKFESYELVTHQDDVARVLEMLSKKPQLAVDIETTGLRVGEAEILTIAFAWDKYNAITIACHDHWCTNGDTEAIVGLIKDFLRNYNGNTIYHNSLFDLKQMAYCWWMKDFSNYEGLYEAMEDLGVKRVHDTMLLAYAELNSTERPPLGLKVLAKDFLGDWAENVTDCKAVKLEVLAEYNAKDTCGTFYVYEKFKHQETSRIYTEILQPSIEYLLHEMINGMPVDMGKVDKAMEDITVLIEEAENTLKSDTYVKEAEENLNYFACEKYNATHKGQKEPWQFETEFNPNSAVQLRVLLFDVMGFEPIEFTEGGSGKTDRASITEFISQLSEDDPKLVTLNALKAISETAIIKSTFLTAFKELSLVDKNGNYSLHGNHRLGSVMSGRLSSSEPNMANNPSNSRFGKVVKDCFVAPEGWLFAYADYNALEDRVSTLLTKDPMKVKEVVDGYEGHSLRASFYFKDELEERGIFIDLEDKDSVNRVKDEAADLRQKSKGVTFLKIYGGGAGKIQKVLKCSMERAQNISDAFDELYKVTKQFNDSNIMLAKKQGYLDVAFGLRVKCPRINSKDNWVASAEGRSINNSSTQSYGMLTNKSSILFLEALKQSKYKFDIKMINQVHDCGYYLIKDDAEVVHWANQAIVKAMSWKDDPALEGPVPMEAELDIGRDWAHCKTLKNNASLVEIQDLLGAL